MNGEKEKVIGKIKEKGKGEKRKMEKNIDGVKKENDVKGKK